LEHFYQNIPGWFDYQDIYKHMVEIAPDPARFVEIGSYLGRSAAFMAVEIANSQKRIEFTCVDVWTNHHVYVENDVRAFVTNMQPARDYYDAIIAKSVHAAAAFADKALDFVWIDGDHELQAVRDDIRTWLPKVKSGGWIGGHDYTAGPASVGQAVRELISDFQLYPMEKAEHSSWMHKVP
jgi:predicted O-methyltransferase YrrM